MALLGTLGLILIIGLGYLLVYSPLETKRAEQEAALKSAKAALVTAETSFNTTLKFSELYPQVKVVADDTQVRFPSTTDVDALRSAVSQAASDAGIQPEVGVTSITTGTPALIGGSGDESGKSAVAEMPASISIEGNSDSLLRFIENLTAMDRVILVRSVDITLGESPSLNISGLSYLYKPIVDPFAEEQEAPSQEEIGATSGVEGDENTTQPAGD